MSLINCPECNKQISDKANHCPECGFPLNESNTINEEYLCCPVCFSKQLHVDKKGFSGKNAVMGALLTGGVGLMAGTIGSNSIVITCLKCNHIFKSGEAKVVKNIKFDKIEVEKEVKTMLENGNELHAVKYYLDKTQCGLLEAKNKIEEIKGSKINNSGCAPMLLFCVIFSLTILLLS